MLGPIPLLHIHTLPSACTRTLRHTPARIARRGTTCTGSFSPPLHNLTWVGAGDARTRAVLQPCFITYMAYWFTYFTLRVVHSLQHALLLQPALPGAADLHLLPTSLQHPRRTALRNAGRPGNIYHRKGRTHTWWGLGIIIRSSTISGRRGIS